MPARQRADPGPRASAPTYPGRRIVIEEVVILGGYLALVAWRFLHTTSASSRGGAEGRGERACADTWRGYASIPLLGTARRMECAPSWGEDRSRELRLQRPQAGAGSHGQAQPLARARRFCSFFFRAARLRAVFRRLGARLCAGITASSRLDVNRS